MKWAALIEAMENGPRTGKRRQTITHERQIGGAIGHLPFGGPIRSHQHQSHSRVVDLAAAIVSQPDHQSRYAIHRTDRRVAAEDHSWAGQRKSNKYQSGRERGNQQPHNGFEDNDVVGSG